MKGRISKLAVVDVCLEGIASAQNEYFEMSGGDWVYWAPEYFITTTIARCLHQAKGSKYVTIENGAYDALDYAGAIGKVAFMEIYALVDDLTYCFGGQKKIPEL